LIESRLLLDATALIIATKKCSAILKDT